MTLTEIRDYLARAHVFATVRTDDAGRRLRKALRESIAAVEQAERIYNEPMGPDVETHAVRHDPID